MERLIEDYYVILSLLLACADLLICIGAFRRKGALGRYVGIISVFAIIVDISYMFSIYVSDYFIASYCSSIYFAGIDWTFIFFVEAMVIYAGVENNSRFKKARTGARIYACFDTLVLLINRSRKLQ